MRLYRGLKTPYRPAKVDTSSPYPAGTDFTDCPYAALLYASTPRGVVLVLEVPPTAELRVSEELWLNDRAKRLIVWGRFDSSIVRVIPAKELRAQLRKKWLTRVDYESKAILLAGYIDSLPRDDVAPNATVGRAPVCSPPPRMSECRPRRGSLSTATVTPEGQIVPWLAADGPLAYSPEEPPDRDYYFQYGWVLPGIIAEHMSTRRPLYFGAWSKADSEELVSFWRDARNGTVRFCRTPW